MSITSFLRPGFSSPVPSLGSGLSGKTLLAAAQPSTMTGDVLSAASTVSAPVLSLHALATPRGAALPARAFKSSSVPALSADDYLDLQQSVAALSQSAEGAAAVSSLKHVTAMAILRNLGAKPQA